MIGDKIVNIHMNMFDTVIIKNLDKITHNLGISFSDGRKLNKKSHENMFSQDLIKDTNESKLLLKNIHVTNKS